MRRQIEFRTSADFVEKRLERFQHQQEWLGPACRLVAQLGFAQRGGEFRCFAQDFTDAPSRSASVRRFTALPAFCNCLGGCTAPVWCASLDMLQQLLQGLAIQVMAESLHGGDPFQQVHHWRQVEHRRNGRIASRRFEPRKRASGVARPAPTKGRRRPAR